MTVQSLGDQSVHHEHDHAHGDHSHADHLNGDHSHGHEHIALPTGDRRVVALERAVLAKNDSLAERNRSWFAANDITALNIVSSPGSGKTTLLERTIRDLGGEFAIYVIEGDQATDNDGRRIRAAGAPVVQLNTGSGCHLDASMIERALEVLQPSRSALVVIENIGNLVCPALFDLGESLRVAILSVTEGDDKPRKYPDMFVSANVLIVNKTDLLPYVDFDVDACVAAARSLNPNLVVVPLSAKTGEGIDTWYDLLRAARHDDNVVSALP